jgi:ubiquinone/menaquinone biosynthesis C-methylase UbiE
MNKDVSESDVRSANRDYYNAIAETYLQEEAYGYTETIQNDVRRILRLAAENASGRDLFLDLGCGSGFLSKLVHEAGLMDRGIGIDVSEKQIEMYNDALAGTPFRAELGDAANLELGDCSVDMIAGYSVLHHFYDYRTVLRECLRVLRPGGVFYFDFEPNAKFKKGLSTLINVRRRLVDHSPGGQDELEAMAEYHNNHELGIDRPALLAAFAKDVEIVEVGNRYPGTLTGRVLKLLSRNDVDSLFSPLFYAVARKR